MIRRTFFILGVLLMPFIAKAQINPDNPPEPYFYYKLTVQADPDNISWNSGNGNYLSGTQVRVNSSLYNSNYKFTGWTLNGDTVSKEQNFYFTMPPRKSTLVAHYRFEPVNPVEPTTQIRNRLFLESAPLGVCSFNRTSGEKVTLDSYVSLRAYPNQGYEFLGWYDGSTLVSSTEGFSYYMPDRNVTLTATYRVNPANPADPQGSGQGSVVTHVVGDINGDNVVDVSDFVAIINGYLADRQDSDWIALCDMNKDGLVDVTDAVLILNIYLKKN